MKFALERFENLVEEIAPLIHAHYKEISHYQDIELKPNWAKYQLLQDVEALRMFTARDESGALVGYGVFFVQKNMHYSDSLQAVQDILFIRKENRGSGGKLIKYCDEALKKEGVQVVYQHVKQAHNFGPLLERMNYKLVDLIYSKRLDKGEN